MTEHEDIWSEIAGIKADLAAMEVDRAALLQASELLMSLNAQSAQLIAEIHAIADGTKQ